MKTSEIISFLPYQKPFLFVDGIDNISEEGVTGNYTFKKGESFYEGHFKNNPITPGVILTECMAQIGLVCLGIYLLKDELKGENPQIALTSHQMDFYLPVLPEEKVTVVSEKEVFRFNKLKCKVKMLNRKGELVARGTISGMLKA
ncbi:hydroxymyristoyl-ACP dehydratase [Winogradskyella sp. PC-19]|uniref:3-hydroxyacyl-ACP dehydratase FabZ family protein n=1 Tax=unclassified Winogradskyella TaxID=2615021 RepID=UPI000B3C4328|nr:MULTISPECIES: beta-hydroxyacyl-ACP dehydratase [unclassified Winogradskyella]ARV09771.1 hydroxymyristoyl-ACP dehydratase [Winogradskyella sp. PC-19]